MKVAAAKADSYDFQTVEQGINEILAGLGGLDQYIKPGDRVLLKPNLVEGMPPEKAVNTHPVVLRAVHLHYGGIHRCNPAMLHAVLKMHKCHKKVPRCPKPRSLFQIFGNEGCEFVKGD